jgi:hypothetical protein
MPTYIYVQLKNVDKAAKIDADKVEEEKATGTLLIKKGDNLVGKIDQNCVVGWWKQFE